MPAKNQKIDYNVTGRRIGAALLDIIIWVVILVIAAQHFGQYSNGTNGLYNASLNGTPALVFIIADLAYFVVFEWLFGGTIGKLAIGIRVMTEQGKKISFASSLTRNLLRIVDGFPYIIPNLVGFLVLVSDDKKQRLGDRLAKTLIVKA